MTDEKPFYSVREFADLIGWPRRTVRYYLKKQHIRGLKPQNDWKIPRKELVKWKLLEENESS
jgi:excisionase family DNA binding protein